MTTQTPWKLRIFYDGRCPLCVAEMRQLVRLDKGDALSLEDICHENFSDRFPDIDISAANRILHGQLPDGRLIYGLDVTCHAWRAVGRGHWISFLRWPLIRPLADLGYRFFARHRYLISRLLTGKPRCETACGLDRSDS